MAIHKYINIYIYVKEINPHTQLSAAALPLCSLCAKEKKFHELPEQFQLMAGAENHPLLVPGE